MLKIKSILVSLLALGAMASCSTNELEGEDTRTGADLDLAYISLRITLPTQKASTRAAGTSTEKNPTGREGDVNSLYVITFDKDQKLVHHSRKNPVIVLGSGDLALQASGNQGTTEAILVSASTKYLLVVVNPGTLLETRLKALTAGALYNDINMAIVNSLASNSKPETLVGEIADPADSGKGFTMINAGSYDVSGDKWNQGCLLDVETNVISVDGTTIKDEAAAKDEAEKEDSASISAWYSYYKGVEGHVQYYKKNLLVYRIDYNEFTGGAHGIYMSTFLNMDLRTLSPIRLDDIFVGEYQEALTDLLWNQLMADNKATTRQEVEEMGYTSTGDLEPTENFYLSEKGITFYYNIYEIAPYVMGPVEITLPYEIMSHLLSDEKGVLIMNS